MTSRLTFRRDADVPDTKKDDPKKDEGQEVDFEEFLGAYKKLFDGVVLTPEQGAQLIAVVKKAAVGGDGDGDEGGAEATRKETRVDARGRPLTAFEKAEAVRDQKMRDAWKSPPLDARRR